MRFYSKYWLETKWYIWGLDPLGMRFSGYIIQCFELTREAKYNVESNEHLQIYRPV